MSILQSLDAPLSVALEALSMLLCLLDVQPQAGPVHIAVWSAVQRAWYNDLQRMGVAKPVDCLVALRQILLQAFVLFIHLRAEQYHFNMHHSLYDSQL